MRTRARFSDRAELFGGNALADLLQRLAALEPGATFHGAELARASGYSRGQIQRELAKLRRLGVVATTRRVGRAEHLCLTDDPLARTLLKLSRLVDERLGR